MDKVGGYHSIALPLHNSLYYRFIYVKKHDDRASHSEIHNQLASNRTVHVVNLPYQAGDDWIKECFSKVGMVQSIHRNTAQNDPAVSHSAEVNTDQGACSLINSAHVVFRSEKSVATLLSTFLLDQLAPLPTKLGLQGYLEQYRRKRPGLEAIKEFTDKYMAEFDAREAAEIADRKTMQHQIDEDGFQTVVNPKRKIPMDLDRLPKKQKSKELQDFYRFQLREKKRNQLKSLRERFEEDCQQIEKLKCANKFHPE
ncbi:hypothetical protein ABG067_004068 [Albugo candida]